MGGIFTAIWIWFLSLFGSVQTPPDLSSPIDRIYIDKSDRLMTLYRNGEIVKTYVIALGTAPMGDKERQGDKKTPEGIFQIDRRNDQSAYHLSLGIDYPQPEDRARARAGGYSAGGDIFIHGQPNWMKLEDNMVIQGDWTDGCIAVSNGAMKELWAMVGLGVEVEIRP